jgi:Novel toxin 11/Domain of unknown function (DUF4157)
MTRTSKRERTRQTESTTHPERSAGPRGVALAPPDYGIGFVDHASASDGPIQRRPTEAAGGPVASVAPRPSHTGLPDRLKAGIESLSGMAMDDVRVHHNSSEPAGLQALAYTQGTQIHVAPGQDRHLPHEAWHVVQQAQGRVQPTMPLEHGVAVNDDEVLEQEADVMGQRASASAAWFQGAASQRERSRRTFAPVRGLGPEQAGLPIQRVKFKDASAAVTQAQIALETSLLQGYVAGITEIIDTPTERIKRALDNRFPNGPIFSATEYENIKTLNANPEATAWLWEIGIGDLAEAARYLVSGNYTNWLMMPVGQRLLIATYAWKHDDEFNFKENPNPPPAYTLARHMALKTGNLTGDQKKPIMAARDKTIRDAFVNMLTSNPAEAETDTLEMKEYKRNNEQANLILTRIFLILRAGLKVYDPEKQTHVDYREGDVARALAHGGRVNIRIPALRGTETARDLTDWLGITGQGIDVGGAVFERGFGTHHMAIGKNEPGRPGTGTFEETGGKMASGTNVLTPGVKLYGMNVAAGGMERTDFNGKVILPDGAHGHMFIGFTPPTVEKDGALQVGMETTGPGVESLVGYKHTWKSTEATANPESSFYGHKSAKIGNGKLKTSQRYVNLLEFEDAATGANWAAKLNALEQDWANLLEIAGEQAAYEQLVGRRAAEWNEPQMPQGGPRTHRGLIGRRPPVRRVWKPAK